MIQRSSAIAFQEAAASPQGLLGYARGLLPGGQPKKARFGRSPASATPSEHESDSEAPSARDPLEERIVREIRRQLPNIINEVSEALVPRFAFLVSPIIHEQVAAAVAPLRSELSTIREELAELRGENSGSGDSQQVTQLRAENVKLQGQLDRLQANSDRMHDCFEGEQRRARVSNLVIHNYHDTQPSFHGLKTRVQELFPHVPSCDILHCERLAPFRAGNNARPCPVLVKFAGTDTKRNALKSARDLRARRIYLDGDLTPLQQQIRHRKQPRYFALKREGKQVFWRYERLCYVHNGAVREDPGPTPPPYHPHQSPSASQHGPSGPQNAADRHAHTSSPASSPSPPSGQTADLPPPPLQAPGAAAMQR